MTFGISIGTAVAVAGVAAAGAGAYEASAANSNASRAAGAATTELGMQQTQFGEQQQYAQQLQELIANPSSVQNLPGYQFNLDQGSTTVARQMAASGFLGSGNEATALEQYGQNYANSAYTTQAQLLSSLAGFNAPAYGANATGSTNAATSAGSSGFNQLGQALASLGYSVNRGLPSAGSTGYPTAGGSNITTTDFSPGSLFAGSTPSYSTGFDSAYAAGGFGQ